MLIHVALVGLVHTSLSVVGFQILLHFLCPQIPESFADCLGGLLSVVGQNLSLRLEAIGENAISAVHANRTVNWTTASKK